MSLRTRRGLALSLALVFVAAACTGAPATPAPEATPTPAPGDTPAPATPTPAPGDTPAPPPEETPPAETPPVGPTPGGTIIIGEWQLPATVHPYMSSAWVTQQAADPVLKPTTLIDDQGEWIPYLLESLPVAEETADGGMTITMRMKPGLAWSDGETLDANDLVYTYNWAVTQAEAGGCGGCGAVAIRLPDDSDYFITDVEVSADGLEVVWTWQEKYAGWPAWASITPLPEQFFGDELIDLPLTDDLANLPASGPFVFTAAGGNRIEYVPNENFAAFEGPYLDRLVRQYFPDNKDGMITAFLTGEIDQMMNMTLADYAALQQQVTPDTGEAVFIAAWLYEHLEINSQRSETGLDDPMVRNAIHQAIDKADLWETLFPGADFVEACTNAPDSAWWYDPAIECPPYDPEAAMALLDQAGWTGTPRAHEDGRQMRFKMCTTVGNPTRLLTLGKVAQYLSAVGIQSEVVTQVAATLFADYPDITDTTECGLSRGNYDISLFTYLIADPGGFYYGTFHSANIPPNGFQSNWTRIDDPELDALLEDLNESIVQDEIRVKSAAVNQKLVELMPEIPLYYRAEVAANSRHLGNLKMNPSLFGPVWNIHEWFFIP